MTPLDALIVGHEEARSVPTRDQVYVFGAPVWKLSYSRPDGKRECFLIAASYLGGVHSYVQRVMRPQEFHSYIISRYRGPNNLKLKPSPVRNGRRPTIVR